MTLVNFPRKLLAELSIISDEQLLTDLPRLLVTYLDADMAYIGLVSHDDASTIEVPYLHTRLCLERRPSALKGRYSIAGTACEQTLRWGRYVHIGNYSTALEPADLLGNQIFEGYAGASLIDSDGKAAGVLALLSSKPLACANELLMSLEQMANRVSVVLEKMRTQLR